MALIFWSLVGALYRRYQGGWIEWPNPATVKHWFKLILAYALGIGAVFCVHVPVWVALLMGAWIGYGLVNMPYHALGQQMRDWQDFAILTARYLAVTAPVGLLWYFCGHSVQGLTYAPLGALVAPCYWLAKNYWPGKWITIGNADFINNTTCIGELCLGAILVGGLFI